MFDSRVFPVLGSVKSSVLCVQVISDSIDFKAFVQLTADFYIVGRAGYHPQKNIRNEVDPGEKAEKH